MIVFDDVRTLSGSKWKITLSWVNSISITNFEVIEFGDFEFGGEVESEDSDYASNWEFSFHYNDGNSLNWKGIQYLLTTQEVEVKVWKYPDITSRPYFWGYVDPDSIEAKSVDRIISLKVSDRVAKLKDVELIGNLYNYESGFMPVSSGRNNCYPVEYLIKNIIGQNDPGKYPTVLSDSDLKCSFEYEGGESYATLTGYRNWVEDERRAYISVWNRFYVIALSNTPSEQPRTASEVIKLLAQNFGVKVVFLPYNTVFLQQRWRNSTREVQLLKMSKILSEETRVIIPKKGILVKSYQMSVKDESPPTDDTLNQTDTYKMGLIIERNGTITNSTEVETSVIAFCDGSWRDNEKLFHGVRATWNNKVRPNDVRFNDNSNILPAKASCSDGNEMSVRELVQSKIYENIKYPRYQSTVVLPGDDYDFTKYYGYEGDGIGYLNTYQIRKMVVSATKNKTTLHMVGFSS